LKGSQADQTGAANKEQDRSKSNICVQTGQKGQKVSKNPALRKFGFREYIPRKYESPKSRLSPEPKIICSAGNDIIDDAQLLQAVTPSSAGIALH
jgi:hypothetical protein